ncbi:MAG: lysine biosynthesis protein LysW [Candidatus Dadabacteria bacterium]|nr:MAG: lysine biosynthesis protein LysW [Candidatus Dadabacteria bacterium]
MTSGECPLCGANVELESDVIEGELLTCPECGSELEVASLDPVSLKEAPQTEEDWGE